MNISCQCHLRHPLALTRCSDVGRNDAEVDASADGSKARSTNGVAAGCRIGTDTSHRPNGGVGGRRYVPHSRRQSAVFRPSFRSVFPPPAMRIQWAPSTSGMQSRRRAAGTQQPGEKVLTIRSVRGAGQQAVIAGSGPAPNRRSCGLESGVLRQALWLLPQESGRPGRDERTRATPPVPPQWQAKFPAVAPREPRWPCRATPGAGSPVQSCPNYAAWRLPKGNIGHQDGRLGVGCIQDLALGCGQLRGVVEPPDQHMRVEQRSHSFRVSQSPSGTAGPTMSPTIVTVPCSSSCG